VLDTQGNPEESEEEYASEGDGSDLETAAMDVDAAPALLTKKKKEKKAKKEKKEKKEKKCVPAPHVVATTDEIGALGGAQQQER
jgi:hypothetical protein